MITRFSGEEMQLFSKWADGTQRNNLKFGLVRIQSLIGMVIDEG
jgi:hypothetical protein